MGTLSVELARNKARGDKKVTKFSGAVRSLDILGLEKGDKFVIPEEFEIYQQNFSGNTVEYIMVELIDGPNKGNAKPFYPSTFTKSREVYEDDGTGTGVRVHTKGSAADQFRSFGSVQEGMDSLKGKTLEVTEVEIVTTLRFNTDQLMKAQIPTIDIVG